MFLKKKIIPDSFNNEIRQAINTISYNPKNIILAGSFIRKSFRDSSDIDICEKFGSNDEQVANALQDIIKKILHNKEYILLDIKCGIDPIYKNSFNHLGYIKNTEIIDYNEENTLKDIEKFKDLIPLTDYTELKNLLKKPSNLIGYFDLREKIRKLITLRWTPNEVLNGYKKIDNRVITLISSVSTFITKIDMAFIYNGFYTEISNVFSNASSIKNGLSFMPITPNPAKYEEAIKYNLLELLENKKWLKSLKRVYTLALTDDNKKLLQKLFPILMSNIGMLNKCNSILKTFITIKEQYGNKYNKQIKIQLNNLKSYVANIYEFNFNEKTLDKLFDKSQSVKSLESITDKIDDTVNQQTKILIDKYNIKIPKTYIL